MTDASQLSTPLPLGRTLLANRVFLAPMSGITDKAFRERAYRHGAGLVVSEMVASAELARGREESARRIRKTGDMPHMIQLAGRDPAWLAEGARICADEGADIIDINMGCPARKVTGGYCGSALMREPDHALKLIEAVVAAVDLPVTVKMRLGWDDETINAPYLAARAQEAGVAMITVHGRTRCQFYTGTANWNAIRAVRERVSVPLVVNGDIRSLHDAVAALDASGADAVMVGRGHYGAPWLAGRIAAQAAASEADEPRTPAQMARYVVAHHEDMLSLYGIQQGMRHARKHLGWYLERHAPETSEEMRGAIMTSLDPGFVRRALRQAFAAVEDICGAEEAA